jgi:restriction endonuclease Mrr
MNSSAALQQIDLVNSAIAQRQINLLGSPAFQQHIQFINTIGPMIQQYANQFSAITNPLVQGYIEQLQTDLLQEPEEHEVFEHPETELIRPETRERIVTYSPIRLLLEQLRAQKISLHDIHWREFEKVVAELLQQDGYMVELGPGTKDGGKDIVAIKNVPGCGLVMSIWQAKQLKRGNKVDIHVIRELADTRIQFGASKGVIVTTTSLTKDALERIERDRYLVHRVDGNDLLTWIQQTQ